ncbi:hypothetical protein PLESTM_000881300 [Pleodorina starrii]|nr:hypothetical protein PLESTM_000881300 [Pleodorina starrii]
MEVDEASSETAGHRTVSPITRERIGTQFPVGAAGSRPSNAAAQRPTNYGESVSVASATPVPASVGAQYRHDPALYLHPNDYEFARSGLAAGPNGDAKRLAAAREQSFGRGSLNSGPAGTTSVISDDGDALMSGLRAQTARCQPSPFHHNSPHLQTWSRLAPLSGDPAATLHAALDPGLAASITHPSGGGGTAAAAAQNLPYDDSGISVPLTLGPDLATNNNGMYLQLMGAPWVSPVPMLLPGPYAAQTRAMVAAKCGPKYVSASTDIVISSTCVDEELDRTSLILQCFSACPEVTWIKGWPAMQPLIINASDIASRRRLRTHPRLANSSVVIEYTAPAKDGGIWVPIRYSNGTTVNFAALEDPAYGYAAYSWPAWEAITDDGEYLVRYVTYCDAGTGGGSDARFEGPAVRMLIDRKPPVPLQTSLWPDMVYVPGDAIVVQYSEVLDCREPLQVSISANVTNTNTGVVTTLAPSALVPYCEGHTLTLSWNPLNFPAAAFQSGRTVTVQVWGVRDFAGNAATNATVFRFAMGVMNPINRTIVSMNAVLGPVPIAAATRRRALPAAEGSAPQLDIAMPATEDERLLSASLADVVQANEVAQAAGGSTLSDALEAVTVEYMPLMKTMSLRLIARDEELPVLGNNSNGSAADGAASGRQPQVFAVELAAKLMDLLRDNSSALSVGLNRSLARVAGVMPALPLEVQLMRDHTVEQVEEARAYGRRLAAVHVTGLGEREFPDAAMFAAAVDVSVSVLPATTVTAGAAATWEPVLVRSAADAGQDESGGLNHRGGSFMWRALDVVERNAKGHVAAVSLAANAVVLSVLGAIWVVRRRRSRSTLSMEVATRQRAALRTRHRNHRDGNQGSDARLPK